MGAGSRTGACGLWNRGSSQAARMDQAGRPRAVQTDAETKLYVHSAKNTSERKNLYSGNVIQVHATEKTRYGHETV